jgi:hypothetical protein
MPGPVSDSRDPEFGTAANRHDVAKGIEEVIAIATKKLGPQLKNIVEVAQGRPGRVYVGNLSERHWRLIRFGLKRALEDL